jgi:Zn-finger nucleic acid-binding protein
MSVIKFQELWDSHPLNFSQPENFPCRNDDGTPTYTNECAIKMSLALSGAGVNMDICRKTKCDFQKRGHKNHIIRAQELADWLATPTMLGNPKTFVQPKIKTKEEYAKTAYLNMVNKKGIVFFQDFYAPTPQSSNTGDHIDVWNIHMMSGDPNGDRINYFQRTPHIWFWEIKV